MFKFFKDKLKKAVGSFGKQAEDAIEEQAPTPEEVEEAARKEQAPAEELEDTPAAKEHRKKKAKKKTVKKAVKKKPVEKPEPKTPSPAPKEPLEPEEEPEDETTPRPEEKTAKEEPVAKTADSQEEEKTTAAKPPKKTAPEKTPQKKGLFGKLKDKFTKVTLSEDRFDDLFWELEMTLLENNVAIEVIEKIKADLKETLTKGAVTRRGVEELIMRSLRESLEDLFEEPFNLVERVKSKKPYVIAFVGVNGSGKTTTLAKVANLFQQEGLRVVMAASDTFRAAAIDQLQAHANNLGVKLISQGYGADPAAVAYDAIEHAKSKDADIVMIDTAGRLHSNKNLMAELEKVCRVAKPDLKIFIGESVTGNDCIEQAKEFNNRVGIDAIILSKADIDEKGGAAISASYVTKKPILYLGTGQAYGDLQPFDKEQILKTLGL